MYKTWIEVCHTYNCFLLYISCTIMNERSEVGFQSENPYTLKGKNSLCASFATKKKETQNNLD
jgi:hypothetical protein